MPPLADALSAVRAAGRRPAVPYLLVDRARASRLEATVRALAAAGAPALELGFPFSDPIADGPTLAAASGRALAHGTRWSDLLFALRRASRHLPAAVMTYANPVWAHGLEAAARELRAAGASGLIVPDLSLEESGPWRAACRHAGLELVLLAAPSASPERVARIATGSSGFLYLVSRYGTTGAGAPVAPARELASLVAAAHRARPRLPVLIGFGVRNAATAAAATDTGADGIVVGSALQEQIDRRLGPERLRTWFAAIVRGANPAG